MKGAAKIIILPFLCLAFTLFTCPLHSQTDSEVERAGQQADRLLQEEYIQEKIKGVPEKPAEVEVQKAPEPKKEETKFLAKKIILTGCESFPAESFSSILSKLENKEISLGDLVSAAKEVEGEYLKRGIIAAVIIPPQEIKDGSVTLQAIEARMGKLEIPKHKYYNRERLAYYWKTPRAEILRYNKISKSLQLMNKNPDREVKAALHAGKKPGSTDAILTAKTRFPVHGTASISNEGSSETGKTISSFGLRHNNFLGRDDTFLGSYTSSRDYGGSGFYHSMPINFSGASVFYGYGRGMSIPTKDIASSGIKSKTRNVTFSLNQDIYKDGENSGDVFIGFDAKDKVIHYDEGVYSKDSLRIIKSGANFQQRGLNGVTYISPEISQGVDAFGASPRNNPVASRGAKSNFTKFNLEAQHKRTLPFNLQASLKAEGQFSSTKLTPQEQFSLGGIDSVRGYPLGDYYADAGVASSAELLVPAYFIPQALRLPYSQRPLKDNLTFIGFIDYGFGMRRNPSATDKKSVTELAMGTGMRISLYNQALLRMEWGFPIGANHPITQAGKSHFHLTIDIQDNLPEEIERIRKAIAEGKREKSAFRLVDAQLAQETNQLRISLAGYMQKAEQAYAEGKLEEAKEIYKKVEAICESLQEQAQDYILACRKQEEDLKDESRQALLYYRAGKTEKAREIWQKIIQEAQPKKLALKY